MSSARMIETHRTTSSPGGMSAAPGRVSWLGLAATPTFAVMALWSGLSPDLTDMLCVGSSGGVPLNAMTVMYALMSLFHLGPWLSLRGRLMHRGGARQAIAPTVCPTL